MIKDKASEAKVALFFSFLLQEKELNMKMMTEREAEVQRNESAPFSLEFLCSNIFIIVCICINSKKLGS